MKNKISISVIMMIISIVLAASFQISCAGDNADGSGTIPHKFYPFVRDVEPVVNVTVIAPTPLSPKDESLMNGCLDESKIIEWKFIWSEIAGADKYEILVENSNDDSTFIDDIVEIDDTGILSNSYSHQTTKPFSENDGWQWRVRVMVKGEWSDWSETAKFSLDAVDENCVQEDPDDGDGNGDGGNALPDPQPSPNPIPPEVVKKLRELNIRRVPDGWPVLKWNKSDGITDPSPIDQNIMPKQIQGVQQLGKTSKHL